MSTDIKAYTELPEATKQVVLALSIVIDRIGALPRADRDDMFELLLEWRKTGDPEERRAIQGAMEEILAQVPIAAMPLTDTIKKPMTRGLASWARHVGGRIKDLRETAGLSQAELAVKAGLTQSHISRLENAEHSPTHLTLEKIAKALGVEARQIDPCVE
jgi:DNA-binding XRE family transcriptional regulator